MKSSPDQLVDAIIYGRDLGPEGEDYVSEERFEKIRFYLKHGKYPNGADRAEKSRLRSAATHYKLLPPEEGREGEEDAERLMLRDKEVVSDPQRQYEIARQVHVQGQHGGINKTTATIAEKYHWVRIKETVSLVIKNCENCKDTATKTPGQATPSYSSRRTDLNYGTGGKSEADPTMIDRLINFDSGNRMPASPKRPLESETRQPNSPLTSPVASERRSLNSRGSGGRGGNSGSGGGGGGGGGRQAPMAHMSSSQLQDMSQYSGIPLDPQIMQSSELHHQQQRQNQEDLFQQQFGDHLPNEPHDFAPTTTPGDHQASFGHSLGPSTQPQSHALPQKISDGTVAADTLSQTQPSSSTQQQQQQQQQQQRYGTRNNRPSGNDDAANQQLRQHLEVAAHPNPSTSSKNSNPSNRTTRSSLNRNQATMADGEIEVDTDIQMVDASDAAVSISGSK